MGVYQASLRPDSNRPQRLGVITSSLIHMWNHEGTLEVIQSSPVEGHRDDLGETREEGREKMIEAQESEQG